MHAPVTIERPCISHRHVIVMLVALFLVPGLSGCRHRRGAKSQEEARAEVKKVRFEGTTRFKERELREYLQIQKDTTWSAPTGNGDPAAEGRIRHDKRKIIEVYRAAGYYDTEVTDVRVANWHKHESKVIITFIVMEGEPIPVKEVTFHWSRKIPNREKVERQITLKEGGPADISRLNDSRDRISLELLDLGYALSEVKESMTVDRLHGEAHARFEIRPGPICRIGTITLTGLVDVPRDLVEREVAEFEGYLYTPTTKRELEDKLLGMDVFSVVSIVPDSQTRDGGFLDLAISLVEREFQSLRLGLGVGFEPDRNSAYGSVVYNHRNLFGRLWGFQARTKFGWAVVPHFWARESHGPIALIEPSLSKKGLLERELVWRLKVSFDADVEPNYNEFYPGAQLSVSRFFFKRTLATLSYNFYYYFIYDASDAFLAEMERQQPDLHTPYRLTYIEARYRVMLTDLLVDPNNGVVFQVRYALSATSLGSEAQYNKVNPSITFYWQMIPRLQLATRAEVGFLFPYGDTEYTAPWSNFFLGGFNTVRGFGGKKLAPWVDICVEGQECERLETGGRTMVLGNVELRFRAIEELQLVTFLDMGDVQYDVFTFKPQVWNYTVGAGLRYDTPVGKFRFDFGVRANNPEPYTEEPRWGIHLGLGEAF